MTDGVQLIVLRSGDIADQNPAGTLIAHIRRLNPEGNIVYVD
jgi:hypothetical protein